MSKEIQVADPFRVIEYLRKAYGEGILEDVVAYEVVRDPDGGLTMKLTLTPDVEVLER